MVSIIFITLLLINPIYSQIPLEVPKWLELAPNMDSTLYLAAPMPRAPVDGYQTGMWEANWFSGSAGRFRWVDTARDSSFMLSWTVTHSEPEVGYPYHYGNVTGINDTLKLRVFFNNRSSADYCLSGEDPETWFYPVIYDLNADIFVEKALADTSAFGYRFEYWTAMRGHTIIDEPDTIFSSVKNSKKPSYSMIYSIWGVYPGLYRVVLEPTAFLPTGIKLTLDNPNNVFHINSGQNVLDTVNTYCKTAVIAQYRKEFTLANTYVDSIFLLNPNCIPGWALRYHIYDAQFDTTNALDALDSLLNVMNNNLDSFYPDSSEVTEINEWWSIDYQTTYTFLQWKMRYPVVGKMVRFF